jgi:hypothetical protein
MTDKVPPGLVGKADGVKTITIIHLSFSVDIVVLNTLRSRGNYMNHLL